MIVSIPPENDFPGVKAKLAFLRTRRKNYYLTSRFTIRFHSFEIVNAKDVVFIVLARFGERDFARATPIG